MAHYRLIRDDSSAVIFRPRRWIFRAAHRSRTSHEQSSLSDEGLADPRSTFLVPERGMPNGYGLDQAEGFEGAAVHQPALRAPAVNHQDDGAPVKSEELHIQAAKRELCQEFPDLPAHQVGVVVECLWAKFEGARIRDFVPILVRKQAREELRDQDRDGIRVTGLWMSEGLTHE